MREKGPGIRQDSYPWRLVHEEACDLPLGYNNSPKIWSLTARKTASRKHNFCQNYAKDEQNLPHPQIFFHFNGWSNVSFSFHHYWFQRLLLLRIWIVKILLNNSWEFQNKILFTIMKSLSNIQHLVCAKWYIQAKTELWEAVAVSFKATFVSNCFKYLVMVTIT